MWRCQNLEREYRGPRVVRPGILVSPFRCVGRAPRSADTHRMRGCLRHSHPNAALFQVLLCLPTAPGLPLQGNGDFGTSAFFGQLSDKPLLACIWSHGVRTPKRNGWWKIKRWAPSWRIAVVQLINWLGARSFEFNRAALAFPDDTGAAPAMGRERAAPEPPGPGEAPLSSSPERSSASNGSGPNTMPIACPPLSRAAQKKPRVSGAEFRRNVERPHMRDDRQTGG
jgi:hypothetical protein